MEIDGRTLSEYPKTGSKPGVTYKDGPFVVTKRAGGDYTYTLQTMLTLRYSNPTDKRKIDFILQAAKQGVAVAAAVTALTDSGIESVNPNNAVLPQVPHGNTPADYSDMAEDI